MSVAADRTRSMRPLRDSLLRAALLEGEAAVAAWAAARTAVGRAGPKDHDVAWLLALVYRNLGEAGREARDAPRLKGVYRRTWYVNQLKRRELADVVRALEARGVSVLLLGGLPMAVLCYWDLGVRPIDDSEIVVREADAATTTGVPESLGWWFHGPARFARLRSVYRRWRLTHPDGGVLAVRCEPAFAAVSGSAAKDSGDDVAAKFGFSLDGVAVLALAPSAQLLDILVHDSGLPASPDPRSVVDAFMVLRVAGDRMDWPWLISAARRQRPVSPLETVLTYLVRELGGAVPDNAMREIARADRSSSRGSGR